MEKKKILFMPLGIGIAHVGRTLMLAREWRRRGHEIFFAAGKAVSPLIEKEGIINFTLPEIPPKENIKRIRRLKPNFYTKAVIKKFLNAELKLYKKIKPDLVIADTRVTAKISTKIAKIPLITINNTNATKYYDFTRARFPIPIFFLNEFIHSTLLYPLEKEWMQKKVLSRVGPPIVEAFLVRQLMTFNLVMQQYDLGPIKSLYSLLKGDLTLLADVPFFRPTKKLPSDVKLVGPLSWQPPMELPEWKADLENLSESKKPIVYITAAGTGDGKIVRKTIESLSEFPATIVVTTGNAMSLKSLRNISKEDIYITDYLPGDWIMQKARAVVFFGGNSTVYQALINGVPQIILPLHLDQQDNANQLERLGTGIAINPNRFDEKALIEKLSLVIYHKGFKKKSEKYKNLLKKWNGPVTAANEVEKFLRTKKIKSKESFIEKVFRLKSILKTF